MNCVSCGICVYHLGLFVVFPGVFLSSRGTGACPVTTDLIMRVSVRTTTLIVVVFFLLLYPILPLLPRSLPVGAQIRGHIAGPLSPSPLRYGSSFLSREEFGISSLVDSRRIILYFRPGRAHLQLGSVIPHDESHSQYVAKSIRIWFVGIC